METKELRTNFFKEIENLQPDEFPCMEGNTILQEYSLQAIIRNTKKIVGRKGRIENILPILQKYEQHLKNTSFDYDKEALKKEMIAHVISLYPDNEKIKLSVTDERVLAMPLETFCDLFLFIVACNSNAYDAIYTYTKKIIEQYDIVTDDMKKFGTIVEVYKNFQFNVMVRQLHTYVYGSENE